MDKLSGIWSYWEIIVVALIAVFGLAVAYVVYRQTPPAQQAQDPQPPQQDPLLWIWRRGQQVFGAVVATGSVALFLYSIMYGKLPGDLGYDLPNVNVQDPTAYQISSHDPRIDDGEIKQAIGLCRGLTAPAPVPDVSRTENAKPVSAAANGSEHDSATNTKPAKVVPLLADTIPKLLIDWSNTPIGTAISSFELSAISDSERISADRLKYQEATRERQDRIRRYQISLLLLTAAASFLIGIKTLVSNNDHTVSFPLIMQGAWLPISVAALLMPVIATVYSGVIAFDDDGRVSLRYARALAQLEQLHGRIVLDVAGDPLLCGLYSLDPNVYAGDKKPTTPAEGKVKLSAIPARAYSCLMSHEVKVRDWEQRYEQILNDASQTLAQAGDLAKGDAKPLIPVDDATACKDAFDEAKSQTASGSALLSEQQPQVAQAAAKGGPKRQ